MINSSIPESPNSLITQSVVVDDQKNEVTPDELISFCKQKLAAFKYPGIVEIIDEVPKTPTGKFLRRQLR